MAIPVSSRLPGSLASARRSIQVRWRLLLRSLSRSELRNSNLVLLAVAAWVGGLAGLAVVLLQWALRLIHGLAFGMPAGDHLSTGPALTWWRVLLVPVVGGVLVGLLAVLIRTLRPREPVDPIEANALYGGRLSLKDSFAITLLTLFSGGFGASVGMEAAFTQLGSALASRFGTLFSLRREDVRTLVGCGAAAAIAAAFNAPLAGAFYAFELIIGSYTLARLAPVAVASLVGAFTARGLLGAEPIFVIDRAVRLTTGDYAGFFALGLASAGLAIVVMRGVTGTERLFRAWAIPVWMRPAFGGLVVGGIALVYPQILGGGHDAIVEALRSGFFLPVLVGLVMAKILASAVSLGSGFRGGLFSSGLFLGSIFGSAVARLVDAIAPALHLDPLAYALVGMGSVAAAIVGAPVTMVLLILETSGDFSATLGVLVGVITASVAVQQWFGYSFATWRFHLRGIKICSPEDIGWIDELTVGSLMRRDVALARAETTLAALREAYPTGSAKQVFVVDEGGRLLGKIDIPELHGEGLDGKAETARAADLVREASAYLLPRENVRTALDRFRTAASEALPVVGDPQERRVIGYLSEAYALRRYTQELERRRGLADEAGLFSPAPIGPVSGAAAER